MPGSFNFRHAARILHAGGVIAYPTEGVYGLGCLPQDPDAVHRILKIKRRDMAQGLILIASEASQLSDWAIIGDHSLESSEKKPVTWIVDAKDSVPVWIRGEHSGIAVRITQHPVARALCAAANSALVSTSANLSGHEPARNSATLRRQFGAKVDFIVPGNCGPASGASEIRALRSGKVVRSA